MKLEKQLDKTIKHMLSPFKRNIPEQIKEGRIGYMGCKNRVARVTGRNIRKVDKSHDWKLICSERLKVLETNRKTQSRLTEYYEN